LAQKRGKTFDTGGSIARSGQVDEVLLSLLSSLDYYSKDYPKSLDNNWIRRTVWPILENAESSIEDKLHTCCQHIVDQIVYSLDQNSSGGGKVVATGGGAHNTFLVQLLDEKLKELGYSLTLPESRIIDFKEAMFIGLMAFFYSQNLPNVISSATGSRQDHIGGALIQGWKKQIHIS
ncbi:MAG: anhydro-N-acetylmuramic acid kinase, partial [Saprospiraceae bacterium]|nr:anhydro-N-acetylmuramic acid kinase [Saprospiraceae bacterium]